MCLYTKAVNHSRFQFRSIATFAGKFIYLDRLPSTEYERKVDEHAMKLIKHTIVTLIFIGLSFVLVIVGPVYVLIVHGEYAIPTGVIVPFVQPDDLHGFIINILVQTSVSVVGLVAIFSIEIASCMINNTYTVMTESICFNLRKFDENLRQGMFSYEQKMELRNLLVQLQDLESYFKGINDIFYWRLLTQPILTTACVSLAIFAQLTVKKNYSTHCAWYLLTKSILFASTERLAFRVWICDVFIFSIADSVLHGQWGQRDGKIFRCNNQFNVLNLSISHPQCERIHTEIYNMKWHLLPPKYRKQVAAILLRWQIGCNLRIGPFGELDYETASNVSPYL